MKNYEKYADEIRKYKVSKNGFFCNTFIMPYILKKDSCNGVNCEHCHMLQTIWLLEEYKDPEESEIDWSKVEVDTPILVRWTEDEEEEWMKRHFAKYENGVVYAWRDRYTSWTVLNNEDVTAWKYAKLAESEEK